MGFQFQQKITYITIVHGTMDFLVTRGRIICMLLVACGTIFLVAQNILYDLRVDNFGPIAAPPRRAGMNYSATNGVHMNETFHHIHWFVQVCSILIVITFVSCHYCFTMDQI